MVQESAALSKIDLLQHADTCLNSCRILQGVTLGGGLGIPFDYSF